MLQVARCPRVQALLPLDAKPARSTSNGTSEQQSSAWCKLCAVAQDKGMHALWHRTRGMHAQQGCLRCALAYTAVSHRRSLPARLSQACYTAPPALHLFAR